MPFLANPFDFTASLVKPGPSPASLMLANLPIYYSADDAQVELLEKALIQNLIDADQAGYASSSAERAWADQFGRDIVAAGKKRAKGKK